MSQVNPVQSPSNTDNKGYLNVNSSIKSKIFCCIFSSENENIGNANNTNSNMNTKENKIIELDNIEVKDDKIEIPKIENP